MSFKKHFPWHLVTFFEILVSSFLGETEWPFKLRKYWGGGIKKTAKMCYIVRTFFLMAKWWDRLKHPVKMQSKNSSETIGRHRVSWEWISRGHRTTPHSMQGLPVLQPDLPSAKTWNTIPWTSIRLPEPTCHLHFNFHRAISANLGIW